LKQNWRLLYKNITLYVILLISDYKIVFPAKADCPVCGIEIATTMINSHLDSCLAREEKKNSLRQNTPKRLKR